MSPAAHTFPSSQGLSSVPKCFWEMSRLFSGSLAPSPSLCFSLLEALFGLTPIHPAAVAVLFGRIRALPDLKKAGSLNPGRPEWNIPLCMEDQTRPEAGCSSPHSVLSEILRVQGNQETQLSWPSHSNSFLPLSDLPPSVQVLPSLLPLHGVSETRVHPHLGFIFT